ncbi:MAG: response regulator transcription factor [Actinobacteria bacterium]|nr:response regulator transcription factor [Actinomycetota bacterium]
MKKILIVDDEAEIRELIKDFLIKENFVTDLAASGKEALIKLSAHQDDFDLVILDIMMPEIDGIEVLKTLRKTSSIPVIFLTSKNEEIDKILGLEIGADDYITKPFNPREMVARIKAVLRRSSQEKSVLEIKNEDYLKEHGIRKYLDEKPALSLNESKNRIIHGRMIRITYNSTSVLGKIKTSILEINTDSRRVFINGKEARLTNKEYQLLLYLVMNKNIVISREKILENVWGYDFTGETRTIDVHIKELRKKIGDGSGKLIETIWATGYRLNYEKDLD